MTIETTPATGHDTTSDMVTIGIGVTKLSLASVTGTRKGRKPVSLPTERIERLAGQGLGSRQIAKALRRQGIWVSHMTIIRHLREVQG